MAPERTESASLRSHSCLSQTTHTCTHSVCTLQYIRPAHTRAAFTMVKPRQKAVISCAVDELLCFYRDLFEISGRNTPLRKTPPCRQRGPRERRAFFGAIARESRRGGGSQRLLRAIIRWDSAPLSPYDGGGTLPETYIISRMRSAMRTDGVHTTFLTQVGGHWGPLSPRDPAARTVTRDRACAWAGAAVPPSAALTAGAACLASRPQPQRRRQAPARPGRRGRRRAWRPCPRAAGCA